VEHAVLSIELDAPKAVFGVLFNSACLKPEATFQKLRSKKVFARIGQTEHRPCSLYRC
jgi:hypothetical protein